MPRADTFLTQINTQLRRAAALHTPVHTALTPAQFQLRWPRYWNLDAQHLALTLRLIEKRNQVQLSIVDGGFGCLKLTIEIDNLRPRDARKLAERLFADAEIARLLDNAGSLNINHTRAIETRIDTEMDTLTGLEGDAKTQLTLSLEAAEEAIGITPPAGGTLQDRVIEVNARAVELRAANDPEADKAEKSAWWLGDIIGGILGGLTKSLGG
ncbi:MAG: hypothetical protein AAGL96_00195 [Pseudomonadota bacterium]